MSQSTSTVDADSPTGEHGRYRRWMLIVLRENSVDIDGQSDPYGVATISRLLKIIGLFYRISTLL